MFFDKKVWLSYKVGIAQSNKIQYNVLQTGCSWTVALAERSHVNVEYHWLLLDATHFKPDDYQQWQLEFENRKHKTDGYLIHISLGLRKRLFYFRTVYVYTSVRVYVLYCTYVITYM